MRTTIEIIQNVRKFLSFWSLEEREKTLEKKIQLLPNDNDYDNTR